jgi:hypothetical protein
MIIKLTSSPLANKRMRAEVETPNGIKVIDFGFKGKNGYGYTYVDGASVDAKRNYLNRHLANATEKVLIKNLVPSASLLSAYILWGETRNIAANVKHLNDLWKRKHLGKTG